MLTGRPPTVGTPMARFDPARWCQAEGCGTRLSTYNAGVLCGPCLRAGCYPSTPAVGSAAGTIPPPKKRRLPPPAGRRQPAVDAARQVAEAYAAGVRPGSGHYYRHYLDGSPICGRARTENAWYHWSRRHPDSDTTGWRPFIPIDWKDDCGLRPARPKPKQPCGTYAAYRRHIRRGEQPCPECLAARRLYLDGLALRRRKEAHGVR